MVHFLINISSFAFAQFLEVKELRSYRFSIMSPLEKILKGL